MSTLSGVAMIFLGIGVCFFGIDRIVESRKPRRCWRCDGELRPGHRCEVTTRAGETERAV